MPPNDFFNRDANRVPITTLGLLATKTIAFTGASGLGAVGAVTLFDIEGTVAVNAFGFCTEDLVSAGGGTVEMGTASSTACLANQQNATAVDNHEVWHDAVLAIGGQVAGHVHTINEDIILTVATADVTDGTIVFYCSWTPLTASASVTST